MQILRQAQQILQGEPFGSRQFAEPLDHVGLAVPDLDEAVKFHTEVLGWRELHREVNEEQGVAEAMIGTTRLRLALDRVAYWKSVGAQASDTVERLVKQAAAKVAA